MIFWLHNDDAILLQLQPNDEPSDESLEFEEGDTESDIEVEFDGVWSHFNATHLFH